MIRTILAISLLTLASFRCTPPPADPPERSGSSTQNAATDGASQAEVEELRARVAALEARLKEIEEASGTLEALQARLDALERRLAVEPDDPAIEPPPEGSFQIWHSLSWDDRGGPESLRVASDIGALWCPMMHNKHVMVWAGRDWLDISPQKIQAAVRGLGLSSTYEGLLVIDYEPYQQEKDPKRLLPAYIEVVEALRVVVPNAKIGFFSLPVTPLLRDVDQVEAFAPLWPLVDVVCPQLFSRVTTWSPAEERLVRNRMQEALRIGKPIIPVIHSGTATEPSEHIEPEAMAARVALAQELGAIGVVLWDHEGDDAIQAAQLAAMAEATQGRAESPSPGGGE